MQKIKMNTQCFVSSGLKARTSIAQGNVLWDKDQSKTFLSKPQRGVINGISPFRDLCKLLSSCCHRALLCAIDGSLKGVREVKYRVFI